MDDALDASERRTFAATWPVSRISATILVAPSRPACVNRVEVEDDHAMTLGEQLAGGVGADVSGTASDEDAHRS